MEENLYPEWLWKLFTEDIFPWNKSLEIKPIEFRNFFTLHDSTLLKFAMETGWENDLILLIQWDTFWNKEYFDYPGDKIKNWPYLILKIFDCKNINIKNYVNIGNVQRSLSDVNIEFNDFYTSKIYDNYGGEITITHNGNYKMLLYKETGEIQEIKLK